MNKHARERLEKQLAFGMALVNGANTLVPVGLLYIRPDQLLGQQLPLSRHGNAVAVRISASLERKPYSCANLQSLAYAAMSAVDLAAFGRAEAFTSAVGGTNSVTSVNGESVDGEQDIYSGGRATGITILNGGSQYIYTGGASQVNRLASGGELHVYSGGTSDVSTMESGAYIAAGKRTIVGLLGDSGGSAAVNTMLGGTAETFEFGRVSATYMSGGIQIVNTARTFKFEDYGGAAVVDRRDA